ncbi:hypothetical protein B0T10DRAFT_560038 [Thelonectria olida]|uniref:Zn(2)-C6 fungal-type domain-containing protein n=1 Tax=Thelonectria olida TaxID=1576542 RepID=A0A9P8W8V3_9HYPO|nr:hypothetical protein B0T10DRAFT_560038 [Thelonectria olida]
MAKRTWTDANWDDSLGVDDGCTMGLPTPESPTCSKPKAQKTGPSTDIPLPHISRRITACVECRKRKIKCLMGASGSPCRRCAKRKLDCVLSKSVQTIIDERSPYSEDVLKDIRHMYIALKGALNQLGLPDLPPLLSSTPDALEGSATAEHSISAQHQPPLSHSDDGPVGHDSPEITPFENDLPYVPIDSLYTLTKLSALRWPRDVVIAQSSPVIDDFIARGSLSLSDAERLFTLYRDYLDPHMFGIGCHHQTLHELRQKSPILTAASLTVAAFHDPAFDDAYGVCKAEFRRLMEKSMFEPSLDQDCLRAMCIASHWLIDLSWMVSGHAIRRATERNLYYNQSRTIKQCGSEAADSTRLWYLLFICDQQLATLYRRPSMIQEVDDWEDFLASSLAIEEDQRLIAQVALMNILSSMREVLSSIKDEPTTKAHSSQLCHFQQRLDYWYARWSAVLEQGMLVGSLYKEIPLHYNFAQLYLYSHIFQGLAYDEFPFKLYENATKAVSAAIAIVNIMTADPSVTNTMAGMPSYTYSMTGFACVFLIKVAVKYGEQLVQEGHVYELVSSVARCFRSLSVGKWHLARLMADGLEKALEKLERVTLWQSPAIESGIVGQAVIEDVSSSLGCWQSDLLLDHDLHLGLPPELQFNLGCSTGANLL